MPSPRRVFYGWFIVAAALVITTITSGLTFYNLSVLLAAFVRPSAAFRCRSPAAPPPPSSLPAASAACSRGASSTASTRAIVIAGGATLGAAALFSVGMLHETWQLFAFHVVFGFAHGATGLVPVTTVIARWFNVRRSLAFSIGSTGLSFGGILVAPFVALAIERYGLADAAPWMAHRHVSASCP